VLRYAKTRRVAIEFSVPRVLRGTNALIHEVTATELVALVERLPRELVPETTRRGAKVGQPWTITRLDLAIDFPAPVSHLLSVYQMATSRWVRWEARRDRQMLKWCARRRANGLKIVLYDKGAQLNCVHGDCRYGNDAVARLEVRLWGNRLATVVDALNENPNASAPRLWLKRDRRRPMRCHLDYQRLHALLRDFAADLDGGPAVVPPLARRRSAERQALIEACAAHPPLGSWKLAPKIEGSGEDECRAYPWDLQISLIARCKRITRAALLHARRAHGMSLVLMGWSGGRKEASKGPLQSA